LIVFATPQHGTISYGQHATVDWCDRTYRGPRTPWSHTHHCPPAWKEPWGRTHASRRNWKARRDTIIALLLLPLVLFYSLECASTTIKNKLLENLLYERVVNNASARSSNLTSAFRDLELWPLHSTVIISFPFHVDQLCRFVAKSIHSSQSIVFTRLVTDQQTNGPTDSSITLGLCLRLV